MADKPESDDELDAGWDALEVGSPPPSSPNDSPATETAARPRLAKRPLSKKERRAAERRRRVEAAKHRAEAKRHRKQERLEASRLEADLGPLHAPGGPKPTAPGRASAPKRSKAQVRGKKNRKSKHSKAQQNRSGFWLMAVLVVVFLSTAWFAFFR